MVPTNRGEKPTARVETYVDDEYGYRLVYPADWRVEAEPAGGASFDDPRGSAGATVTVDDGVDCTLTAYVAAFLDALEADDHIGSLEALDRRDVALEGGRTASVVEYAYRSDGERWRLTYLFALAEGTGYVLGVDWNDEDDLDELATRVAESFALETD
ncbi:MULTISPECIES: hypothetical protein [Saliphagus]|uniref:PsbP C-terminal domain-containing protein n=1 Tax=Saliphagus infecundisoli TaxID=1849069 RepID=A0ABD5QJ40_9EURY|nr:MULTISPECIES: hypothetical protein [Saliphagus]